jgi:hypothetical protein
VCAVAGLDGDVADDAVTGGLHQVDGTDVAAGGPMADARWPSIPGRLVMEKRTVRL